MISYTEHFSAPSYCGKMSKDKTVRTAVCKCIKLAQGSFCNPFNIFLSASLCGFAEWIGTIALLFTIAFSKISNCLHMHLHVESISDRFADNDPLSNGAMIVPTYQQHDICPVSDAAYIMKYLNPPYYDPYIYMWESQHNAALPTVCTAYCRKLCHCEDSSVCFCWSEMTARLSNDVLGWFGSLFHFQA